MDYISDTQLDKNIKSAATKRERVRIFENMNAPEDIYAECSNGLWVRRVWRNPNGRFGWDKWTKV